ncbi:FtsW/RodA/SpoVE family cell cycle protein [Mangrovibacillus cuniculi]|uniref:Probable peptidoglycan glycosyltransferase FtsW n=1 Tax=Mangrovibacillus cuniculi TaxID=2593652 RepID=A0A7S8CA86_9BACI|nr:FtsW/RodA/SpoVE family cell cycle protein [Mangrovibacillus cuniculi]QPC46212.1 FtsW/RodA/SpoVE family cell cycle protein [Mangrovibacillus cuniculi]
MLFKKILRSYDYSLVITYFVLCFFGLVMIYSASMVWAASSSKFNYDATYFYDKQQTNIIVGAIAFFVFAIVPYKVFQLKPLQMLMVIGSFALLAFVLFTGNVVNNAQSWFTVGTRALQPAELAKLSVILFTAFVYNNKLKSGNIQSFGNGVLPPIFYLVLICFLIFLQPDVGTAFIIFSIGLCMILASGVGGKNIIKLVGVAVVGIGIMILGIIMSGKDILTDERVGRFIGYLEPFENVEDDGYHLVQSLYAIGSGGLSGKGLGESIQKMGYLPEAHTDFIMAIISEELGIFGVFIVVVGLGYIIFRGLTIAVRCRDPFGTLIAVGVSAMFGIQSFINLGGMSGLIPITGVTLPFISYGGSSMIVMSAALGLLVNISMFTKYDHHYRPKKSYDQQEQERQTA